eukprot:gene12283-biopygen8163
MKTVDLWCEVRCTPLPSGEIVAVTLFPSTLTLQPEAELA